MASKTDLAALEERMDARFEALRTELGANVDMGLVDVRGELKSGFAKQTYVMLVTVAALVTPVYLALFGGG